MFSSADMAWIRTSQVMYFWITFMGSCEPYLLERARRGRGVMPQTRFYSTSAPSDDLATTSDCTMLEMTGQLLPLTSSGCATHRIRVRARCAL